MRFFITKKVLVTIIVLLALIMLAMALQGCGSVGLRPPAITDDNSSGVSGIVANLSLYLTALATLGFVGCIVAAFWTSNWIKFGKGALGCLIAISASQFAYWYGKHVGLITWLLVAAAVIAAGVYLWLHIRQFEKKTGIDIDRNGKIG